MALPSIALALAHSGSPAIFQARAPFAHIHLNSNLRARAPRPSPLVSGDREDDDGLWQ